MVKLAMNKLNHQIQKLSD